MSAFKPTGRTFYAVKVPHRVSVPGPDDKPREVTRWAKLPTGLKDETLADAMQAMLDTLRQKDAWEVLNAIASRDLELRTAHAAWRRVLGERDPRTGKLREPSIDARVEAVRMLLNTTNLRAEVPAFVKSLGNKVVADTAAHYAAATRAVFAYLLECEDEEIPTDDTRAVTPAMLTPAALTQAFDDMNDLWAGGTVRKRGAGFRRFVKYLRSRGLLDYNPMAEVELPPAGKPRTHHLTTTEAKALADAQPEPYRTFAALLAGTGIEVSVALALSKRDVDVHARQIRAAGTKTHARDRVVRVADWAWPYLTPLLDGLLPNARLFEGIRDRYDAGDQHRAAVEALVAQGQHVYEGYTMRDHRHTYAVRAIRAGAPAELVARQLGHANPVLVHRVYSRFAPTTAERDLWEQRAAEQDRAAETTNLHAREG